jgi:dTMP kinase
VERLIEPSLASGKWVICDRFLDSSRAYQGGAGGLSDEEIMALHRVGSRGLLPDITLLIEVSPQEAAKRLKHRDAGVADRIGGRSDEYHGRVAKAFVQLADDEKQRFARIDGNGMTEATHALILAALEPLLGKKA